MASRTLTNILLLLVVLFLGLIGAKMYSVNPTHVAEAAGIEPTKPTNVAALVACYVEAGICRWRVLRVTEEGVLYTTR